MRTILSLLLVAGMLALVACSKKMTEDQLYAQARTVEAAGETDKLIAVYEELADRFSASPKADEVLYKLALLYQNKKQDFAKAVACHTRLREKYSQSRYVPQAHFMSAFIYANDLKDLDKARQEYNSFLQAYPQHELAPSVKWELDHLGQDISTLDLFSNSGQTAKETPLAQKGEKAAAKARKP